MHKKYSAINIFYLNSNQILDFDIYIFLPVNNKYIKYISAHVPLDDVQLLRLKLKNVSELFILEEDISKFNKFLSGSIVSKMSNKNLSELDRVYVIREAAGNVIGSIISLTGEQDAVSWTNNCIDVTQTLISYLTDNQTASIYDKLREMISDRPNLVNHSLLVSSLSVLFGMGLGIYDGKSISELAIGGLLHDIGFSKIDNKIVEKYFNMDSLETNEIEEIKKHPKNGYDMILKMLKSPKVTDNVIKIILEHHENASGKGYPVGKGIPALPYLCRVVAIADRISLQLFKAEDKKVDLKYLVSKLHKAQGDSREFDKNMLGQILETIK